MKPAAHALLSPHEIATLMLIRSAPGQIDMTRAELDTLLASQFVSLETAAIEGRRLALTPAGEHLLDAAARLEQQARREHVIRRSIEA
jgi:hypothetical protein